ncbi:MAG: ankyrin repeat domain-containing protein, partial [Chromatiales bacterium]|nr:ankyrin repeat domain-containing protein [Chromatiales bacterium]
MTTHKSFLIKRCADWRVGLALVAMLLLAGCDRNTDLMKSVMHDSPTRVTEMLANGADVDERNAYGWTALMHAARTGDVEMITLLLDHGAAIDTSDKEGWTALMRAAHRGNLDAVNMLL